MTWLIGFAGKKQSGKSTAAAHLVERYGFTEISFADVLRDMALSIDPIIDATSSRGEINMVRLSEIVSNHGWDRAKTQYPEVRRFLQRLGTEGGRDILGEDVWVDALAEQLDRIEQETGRYHNFVIPDVRFPNEAMFVQHVGVLVKIERPNLADDDPHPSETALDGWRFSHTIRNTASIEDLHLELDALLQFSLDMEVAA